MEIILTFWFAALAGAISAVGFFFVWLFKVGGLFSREEIVNAIKEADSQLFPRRKQK